MSASISESKGGDYFIEDKQAAGFGAEFSYCLKEAFVRRYYAHISGYGFDYYGGDTTYYYYDANGTDRLVRELTADANTFYYYDDNGSLVEEANDTVMLRTEKLAVDREKK